MQFSCHMAVGATDPIGSFFWQMTKLIIFSEFSYFNREERVSTAEQPEKKEKNVIIVNIAERDFTNYVPKRHNYSLWLLHMYKQFGLQFPAPLSQRQQMSFLSKDDSNLMERKL